MFVFLCFLTFANAQLHMTNHGVPGSTGGDRPYRWIGEATSTYQAPSYRPRIEETPYPLSTRTAVSSDSVQAMTNGQKRLEAQFQRTKDAYVRFSASKAIIDAAGDSLNTSVEYFLEERFEEANIAGDIADGLLDLATSLTPGISWGRDLYEAISGKDLHSNEDLDKFSRSMAILGSISFGFASKPAVAIRVFEKLTKNADILIDVRRLLFDKPISELKTTVSFFKRYKIYGGKTDKEAVSVANAFLKDARTRVLDQDLKVIRYYPADAKSARGAWVTIQEHSDPHEALALFHIKPVLKAEFVIPKGTEVLEGIAAPQLIGKDKWRMGGGHQILLDPDLLKDLP